MSAVSCTRACFIITFVAIAVPVGSGCSKAEPSAEAATAPLQFPVASPRLEDVVVERAYVADVRAARHAELRARFKGVIESVAVDEGDEVREGQLLFTINASARAQDVAVARAAVLGGEAELRAAELELENTKLLADQNIVAPAELARVRSKVELQKARLGEAGATVARKRVDLDRSRIRAPFDGVVDRIRYRAGSAIDEDVMLTTVSDAREVLAYFAISEREYLELSRGEDAARQPPAVLLALADGTLFKHEGVIDAVGGEIDAETGTLSYRARFPNPDGTLKHGSSGKVVLRSKLAKALLVPQRSTFETQGNVYVYAVGDGNLVHARKLEVKFRHGDAFVIGDGLAVGERFVVEGVQRLKDGVRIEPIASSPRTTGTRS
ncbi:MAG TPA: efflux RND transporter periplasmic adaptor subunit [Kofleriaceae bacterium]|nr:efflux RND transporter periplasmic adaptor subunit [Kofleriaceae bacterium]